LIPFILAGGVDPVGQEDDDNALLEVHPEGRARKTEMADTVPAEISTAAGTWLGGPVKSQGAFLALSIIQKRLHMILGQPTRLFDGPAYAHKIVPEQIVYSRCSPEQSGVAIDPAYSKGVFIMHCPMNQPILRQAHLSVGANLSVTKPRASGKKSPSIPRGRYISLSTSRLILRPDTCSTTQRRNMNPKSL
jgi:hypothetical protein